MPKKKDGKTKAFEQELLALVLKYGYLGASVSPTTLSVGISAEENPVIVMVALSNDGMNLL